VAADFRGSHRGVSFRMVQRGSEAVTDHVCVKLPRRVRDLTFSGSGTLAEGVGVSRARAVVFEAFVQDSLTKNWTLAQLVSRANETLDMNDAEWTAFIFGLGYWEAQRGR
jgi:hypothetical protein